MTADSSKDPASLADEVLAAVLPHVAFDGWTARSVRHGLEDLGLDPGVADRAFPDGVDGMIRHWSHRSDARMEAEMAAMVAAVPHGTMGVSRRIATAVRLRIAGDGIDREAVRRTLGHLALPGNAMLAGRLLLRTCDAIWYAAGDRAVDISYYSKRASLAAVYGVTLLYWLDDDSPDGRDTWAFLDRRLAGLGRLPRLRGRIEQALRSALTPLAGLGRPPFTPIRRP